MKERVTPFDFEPVTRHPTWTLVEQARQAAKVPVVLKKIMNAEDAATAAGQGVDLCGKPTLAWLDRAMDRYSNH
jgi:hypothetical protein